MTGNKPLWQAIGFVAVIYGTMLAVTPVIPLSLGEPVLWDRVYVFIGVGILLFLSAVYALWRGWKK